VRLLNKTTQTTQTRISLGRAQLTKAVQCSLEQSVNNTQFQDFFRKIDPKSETCQIIKKRNQIL
jgi:hypothetical protein